MRHPIIAALAVSLLAATAGRAPAAPSASLGLVAKHVDFYSDRYVIAADDGVRVRLSDGTMVQGETFGMDLKQNRYIVAGNVHLDGPGVHLQGAAFSSFLDTGRSYFLSASGIPDRWTFFGTDWSDRHAGREQPGDAFTFPDSGVTRPYIVASGATIIQKSNVIFDRALIRTANVYLPSPRYVVTFSANPNFAQNSLAGARAGFSVPFNGSAHSLSEVDVRNDSMRGTYLALQQHFAWDHDYVVASINPITQIQRQYNVIGFKRISPALEARVFFQESATQEGIINKPLDAASFQNIQINAALPHSGVQINADNHNQYLLGITPFDADLRHREHPSDVQLTWFGYRWSLPHTPLQYQLRSGLGLAHDQFGENTYANELAQPPIRNLWRHYVGASLTAPNLRLGKISLSAVADKQRMWYSQPHHVDTTSATISAARAFEKLSTYVAYSASETADYWGPAQLAAYPAADDTLSTTFGKFGGQAAFRGLAVSRGYTAGFTYTPTPYASLSMTAHRYFDAPAPVPGAYGQPPWQLAGDLRVRIAPQILVDVTRAYYFNFANLRWTPQLGIQISP